MRRKGFRKYAKISLTGLISGGSNSRWPAKTIPRPLEGSGDLSYSGGAGSQLLGVHWNEKAGFLLGSHGLSHI